MQFEDVSLCCLKTIKILKIVLKSRLSCLSTPGCVVWFILHCYLTLPFPVVSMVSNSLVVKFPVLCSEMPLILTHIFPESICHADS